jgi:hypothetical protein
MIKSYVKKRKADIIPSPKVVPTSRLALLYCCKIPVFHQNKMEVDHQLQHQPIHLIEKFNQMRTFNLKEYLFKPYNQNRK